MTSLKTATYRSKAIRIATQLAADIRQGKFVIGALLPTEDKLAQTYEVSRMTMRKSLSILYGKGELQKLSHGGALATGIAPLPNENNGTSITDKSQTAKKFTIAVVIAGEPYYSTTQRLNGAKRYADEHQLKFTHFISSCHEDALDVLSRVEEHELDGVIVAPFLDDRYLKVLRELNEKKFPVVLYNKLDPLPMISSVMSSDGIGAYHATHYLIDKYHRPVYYLCSPADSEITHERHQGYINAMRDAGMEEFIDSHTCRLDIHANDPNYWSVDKNWLPGFYAANQLFSRIDIPASIFCENDFDARGVYEAAKKHNLIIGNNIHVVGFGDYPVAKLIKPGLTTCHAYIDELGYEEGRLLHRMIKKEIQPPVHIRQPMDLVVRESA